MYGVDLFIQQRLPALVKSVDPPGSGRQVQHLDTGGRAFGLGRGGPGRRVQHHGAAAQRGKGAGQADLLPVVSPALAGSAAVQLRDGDGEHGQPPFPIKQVYFSRVR